MSFKCKICNSETFETIEVINKRPINETDYKISEKDYHREIVLCKKCGTYLNKHNLLSKIIYSGDYNDSIPLGSIVSRFEKIINLPPEKSDNKKRVDRVTGFLRKKRIDFSKCKIFDIGSGTCVFLYEMKKHGFITYCLDPDKNAVIHASENINVTKAFHGFIDNFESNEKFNIVTLNKVLEHVDNPVEVLKKVRQLLTDDGVLYLELPDSMLIESEKSFAIRSEFFVEHLTIYNQKSIEFLSKLLGFKILELNSIVDPSGKYTIYAFLNKTDD